MMKYLHLVLPVRRQRGFTARPRQPLSAAAPFGGYKQSGNGREWGSRGLTNTWKERSVHLFDRRLQVISICFVLRLITDY